MSARDPRTDPQSVEIRIPHGDRPSLDRHLATHLSPYGLFVPITAAPPPGTKVHFELPLGPGRGVLRGRGTVRWRRQRDPARAPHPFGAVIKLSEVDARAQPLTTRTLCRQQPILSREPGALCQTTLDAICAPIEICARPQAGAPITLFSTTVAHTVATATTPAGPLLPLVPATALAHDPPHDAAAAPRLTGRQPAISPPDAVRRARALAEASSTATPRSPAPSWPPPENSPVSDHERRAADKTRTSIRTPLDARSLVAEAKQRASADAVGPSEWRERLAAKPPESSDS